MKKNIVALITGIVLIFGALTVPAFAEEGSHPCPATMQTMECERFLAGLDTVDPGTEPSYLPGDLNDPVEDPLIGEDGTFTDEAKAEQIDAIEKEQGKEPTQETSVPSKNAHKDAQEKTSGPSKSVRPKLPHTGV